MPDSSNNKVSPILNETLFFGVYLISESDFLSTRMATDPLDSPVIFSPSIKSEVFPLWLPIEESRRDGALALEVPFDSYIPWISITSG